MKVGSKDAGTVPASFALLFVKNYAILDLSDKIYTGGNIWVDFEKNQKNVKNVSKKKLYYNCLYCCMKIEKIFFSKTKDEIDYSKWYKTISMPLS